MWPGRRAAVLHRQRQPLSPFELAHQVSPAHVLGEDIGRVLRHGHAQRRSAGTYLLIDGQDWATHDLRPIPLVRLSHNTHRYLRI